MSSNHGVTPEIQGYCHPRFTAVREAFARNYRLDGEVGAAITVIHNDSVVVDLWGGFQDAARTQPWEEDTLVCMMSTSKAIATIAVLSLVDRGLIALDSPIASYWPEFAQAGKADITVEHLLSQYAGLPVIDNAPEDSYLDLEAMEKALAEQPSLWAPGSTPCYHSFTYGPLCQVLVEKVTGKTLGHYLREDLFRDPDIEFYIGLKTDELPRCADIILEDGIPSLDAMRTPGTLLNRAWKPAPISRNIFQEKAFRCGEFASGNGHGNARSLAQIYHELCQDLNEGTHHLLEQTTLENAIREQWDSVEKVSQRRFRFGTGFMLNNPHFRIGSNPRSFGHPGLGGPTGFADPDANIGFGYCCNLLRATDNTGPCASALINALYDCL